MERDSGKVAGDGEGGVGVVCCDVDSCTEILLRKDWNASADGRRWERRREEVVWDERTLEEGVRWRINCDERG